MEGLNKPIALSYMHVVLPHHHLAGFFQKLRIPRITKFILRPPDLNLKMLRMAPKSSLGAENLRKCSQKWSNETGCLPATQYRSWYQLFIGVAVLCA